MNLRTSPLNARIGFYAICALIFACVIAFIGMKNELQYGIISHQGDFELHEKIMHKLSRKAIRVFTVDEIEKVDALIMPGGESTTLIKFFDRLSLWETVTARIQKGMPVFGTCAGMILLAKRITNTNQRSMGLLDIDVERNGYGRQVDSFEAKITGDLFNGKPMNGMFIRAPRIIRVGPNVEVLARFNGDPVLIRSGSILCAAFHPELAGDTRIHSLFVKMVEEKMG